MENIIDEYGIPLNKTRMEKLETYYEIHQLLQKLLILIQERSDYSELVKIFAFYHCGAYPDNILEYIREVFVKNDLQLFAIDLDDVWK